MASAPSMTSMKKSGKPPTREQMKKFLKGGIAMMKSDATRDLLKDPAILQPGQKLKDMQRSGWDPEGIDQDRGCQALDKIEPSDSELSPLQTEFLHTSMRVYLRALQDRRPRELERTKKIPRAVIIEFFDSCNVRMQLPETHKLLAMEVKSKKQPPKEAIIGLQREQLEVMGWEADHGCKMLSAIGEDFPKDEELHQKFQQWATIATRMGQTAMQMVAQEEMMNDPEKMKMVESLQQELQSMGPEEKKELMERMQKRVQTIKNLPPEEQEKYVQKQGPEFQKDFMKAQMLMQIQAVAQMQKQHEEASRGASTAPTASDPLLMATSAKAPSQQQMM